MLTRANPKSNREEYKGEEQRLVNCKKMVKDQLLILFKYYEH